MSEITKGTTSTYYCEYKESGQLKLQAIALPVSKIQTTSRLVKSDPKNNQIKV